MTLFKRQIQAWGWGNNNYSYTAEIVIWTIIYMYLKFVSSLLPIFMLNINQLKYTFFHRINFHEMKNLLTKFCEITKGNKGHISFDKFAEYLKIPKSDILEEVFAMYDRVS